MIAGLRRTEFKLEDARFQNAFERQVTGSAEDWHPTRRQHHQRAGAAAEAS